ncbi:MAG: Uma2 family endonuclease [Ktedonobacteraceae bacterium]|nr:Uma2 family endonuclease [Ktedonobacteraceae bacterium]
MIEAPTVIIEVLSPGTEPIDRLEKLPVYKAYPTIQDILLQEPGSVNTAGTS